MRYEDAGVSIARGDRAVERIRRHVESTFTPWVVGEFGHFAGLCRLPGAGPGAPLLVASIDGVGTKVLLAKERKAYAMVAGDIVRHGANDCLVLGARPLFFLDYVAWGRLEEDAMEEIVRGMAESCRDEGVALLGGETAEMPGMYKDGDFDIAGCMVGFVREEEVIDGSRIQVGDVVLAMPSTGLHTNGYSLARKALLEDGGSLDSEVPGLGLTVADALLAPHRSYVKAVRPLVERGAVTGLAHVTGGGISGNLVRVLPEGVEARLDRGSWELPAIFRLIQERGKVPEEDMLRTFNLGVGFVLVTRPDQAGGVVAELQGGGEACWKLGEIVSGPRRVTWAGKGA
jgi:phosphoribosylformylglycinamidine cyclo-ligase